MPSSTAQNDLAVSGALTVTGVLTGNGGIVGSHIDVVTVIAGDGAIAVASGTVALTKGSAAAITIVAPTAGQDGTIIKIYTETAFAHVITCASDGFNSKGSSGTATFAAAKGNEVTLFARNGHWWVIGNIGVTIA